MHPLRMMLGVVRFSHTIFALPLALAGALLAVPGWPAPDVLGWIILAMVGARTLAMALNRLIDRDLDRANPRTAGRHLPAGKVRPRGVWLLAGGSLLLLILAVGQLPPLTWHLLPIPLALFILYPYAKRHTSLCHALLGATIGLAPIGAGIAVTGDLTPAPALLGVAVMLWIWGLDIIYAQLDEDHDRQAGIHSLPAHWGSPRARRAAAGLHVLMLPALALAGMAAGLAWPYFALLAVVVALLAGEHRRGGDLTALMRTLEWSNGAVAVAILAGVILGLA